MAVARPVRFLGALSVILVFFLIYQLWQPATPITVPNHRDGDTIERMEKDPLLERTFTTPSLQKALIDLAQL